MNTPKQEIQQFTDLVGPWPTAIDKALGAARGANPAIDHDPNIQAAHALIGKFGAELEKHAAYGRALPGTDGGNVGTKPETKPPQTGDNNEQGWTTFPPTFPSNTTMVTPTPGINGGFDLGTIPLNERHGAVVERGQWVYFKAAEDASNAGVSCDGVAIGYGVGDAPADPGPVGNLNSVTIQPYKAGQFVSVHLGEGGYNATRALLISVMKYAA